MKFYQKNDKHITIIINERFHLSEVESGCVSLDKVKPAFVFSDLWCSADNLESKSFSVDSQLTKSEASTTKSGIRVRYPKNG